MEGKKLGNFYTEKYGNLDDLNCLFCREEMESIQHITHECIYRENDLNELEEEIVGCIKEAIFLSTDENDQNYRFAKRKIQLENKCEILKNIVINKINKEKSTRRKEKEKKKKRETEPVKNKTEKEKKEKPTNIYELEIPETVYKENIDIRIYWDITDENIEDKFAIHPNGLISNQFTTKLKMLNVKKKIIKQLLITIQIILANYNYKIWVERCQEYFKHKNN